MLYSLALQTLPMAALNNLPTQQTEAELHSLLQEPALVPEADQRGADRCALLYSLC